MAGAAARQPGRRGRTRARGALRGARVHCAVVRLLPFRGCQLSSGRSWSSATCSASPPPMRQRILGTSVASVNSALLRARSGFNPPAGRDQVPLPRSTEVRQLADRFVDAFESVDVDKLVALLTEDACFAMPPEPIEFHGPPAIAGFVQSLPFWGRPLKLVESRANGQPALWLLPCWTGRPRSSKAMGSWSWVSALTACRASPVSAGLPSWHASACRRH